MKLITFSLFGNFGAFRDPSVTSNQTVYYIPSKSAVIGILGAIIGVGRTNSLGELYGSEYLKLFKDTKIGIKYDSSPKKITFFTNHRSLKEPKTKPYKTELVEKPNYRIFVQTNDFYHEKIKKSIEENKFKYSPYLGHVYCPAIIQDLKIYDDANVIDDAQDKVTSSVILDESETYKYDFTLRINSMSDDSKVIIERHIHHFYNPAGYLDRRVLKHWIPVSSYFSIERDSQRDLSYFVTLGQDEVVCLF